ncbi:MAG: C25 family cysteine peptidase [bacterium]
MSKRPCLAVCFLFATVGLSLSPEKPATVQLLNSDSRKVLFDFVCGAHQLIEGGAGFSIRMDGTERLSLPGEPELPNHEVLIGVAQTGPVLLRFSVAGTEELSDITVAPAPGFWPVAPAQIFNRDRFWPEQPAELREIEMVRGIRVARVRVNPVQYNPVRRTLRIHQRVRVELEFSRPAEIRPEPDALNPVLERLLLNGKEAVNWKLARHQADSVNFFNRFGIWCKVKTETTGIYQIKPADLKDAGFNPTTIDPRSFHLFTIGRYKLNGPYPDTMIEVPIYVVGEDDLKFDDRDYILFYAQSPSYYNDSLTRYQENYYTNQQVFWLTWGSDTGKRMESYSGGGATAPGNYALNRMRLEQDNLCPARGGLLWLWERYSSSTNNQTFYRPFTLPRRDTIKRLTVRFYGKSDRTSEYYRVVLSLNSVVLDTVRIEARNQAVPPSTFVFESLPNGATSRPAATDTLAIELLNPADIYLDYIETDYIEQLKLSQAQPAIQFLSPGPADFLVKGADNQTLIFDITDPLVPRRITDTYLKGQELQFRYAGSGPARFFLCKTIGFRRPSLELTNPGGLRNPNENADYYIICPDEFLLAARLLARYRQENFAGITNPRVSAVPLSQIYNDYAFGMEEPGAIKAFLAAKRPAYGLLLGDATYDYKDNLRLGNPPGVPAFEIGFDLDYEVYNPYVRALDAWYADFDGEGSSPDMILARVTCRSPYEVRQFLEKIRRYETQELGLWAKRFLLLGDDEYQGSPDRPEGLFHIRDGCEAIARLGPTILDKNKVYLTEYSPVSERGSKSAAELLRYLNLGCLFWCFFGHGAGFQLCHERTFHIDDVPRINNAGRMPLAFFGSCGVGRFEDTRYEAIAEEVVRIDDGCIAALGASKATYPDPNVNFALTLFSYLLANPDQPIGPAFYQAWFRSNLYILFGDPGTKLRLPAPDSPPVVNPDTFNPGGLINYQVSSRLEKGNFEIRATEAERERFYQSETGTITYLLPGQEIFRMAGKFTTIPITGRFVVPRLDYPDTIVVGNGWYARKRNSCRISGIIWDRLSTLSTLSTPLYLSVEPAPFTDSQPPEVSLFADNVRLKLNDTTRVPKRFTLRGFVSDPAGILLIPDPSYGLRFFIGDPSNRVDLADHFSYDGNSAVSGRFSYPVELDNQNDSLIIIASDNYLNRTWRVYHLKTDRREELRLDSCLIYPNPVEEKAWFTFILTGPATVTVKVFTIAGRLVRVLGPKECSFGYNQIEWDGRDRDNNLLASGVYLYKIDARTSEASAGTVRLRSVSYRDRLIIKR